MSNTKSDSSESISIYETPINSPSNESLINSTRIDSSLFGNTSVNTQSIDLLDFRQSFESIPASVATESTLRQTVERLSNECIEQMQRLPQSTDPSVVNSSVWYPTLKMSSLKKQSLEPNGEPSIMLMKCMSELEREQLELIGVEQQIHSLSLKCRTIRDNITSKTQTINLLINEILPKNKQMAQKQTQTDVEERLSISQSCDVNNFLKSEPLLPFPKSNVCATNEPKLMTKTDPSLNNFGEVSENLKKRLSRLPAMVKGYLTRRLMKTEKVLHQIETIRDTTQLLSNYRNTPSTKKVTAEDINFHKRLIIQLERSCHEFYDIFFNYPKSSQMALIRRSRQHILDRHYKTASVLSNSSYLNESFRNQTSPHISISSVTKKVIQRKSQKSRIASHVSSPQSNHSVSNSAPKSRVSGSALIKHSNDRINYSLRRSQRSAATNAVQTHKRKAHFDK